MKHISKTAPTAGYELSENHYALSSDGSRDQATVWHRSELAALFLELSATLGVKLPDSETAKVKAYLPIHQRDGDTRTDEELLMETAALAMQHPQLID